MTPAGEIGFAVASPLVTVPAGQTAFRCHVPPNLLNDGTYTIELLVVENSKAQVVVKDALTFEIDDHARTGAWMGKWPGFVRPHLNWDYEHLADNAKT
jgi:lipopolysaccharide transport system ATP-binding protein